MPLVVSVTILSLVAALPAPVSAGGTVHLRAASAATAIEVQKNGKLVVAGTTHRECAKFLPEFDCQGGALFVLRYRVNGSVDTGFGKGGSVVIPVANERAALAGLDVQPDGRIVIAGSFATGTGSAIVARLTKRGDFDRSFAGDGVDDIPATLRTTGSGNGVAVAPDGGILVTGTGGDPLGSAFAVARFQPGGGLDAAFGDGGVLSVRVDSDDPEQRAEAIVTRPDGRIDLAGTSIKEMTASGEAGFGVAQLLTNGDPDLSFAGDGTTVVAPIASDGALSAGARGLALAPDGDLLMAGTRGRPIHAFSVCDDIAVVRLNADGAVDAGFGTQGLVERTTRDCEAGADLVLAPDRNGRFVVSTSGGGFESDERFAFLDAYAADGSLDHGFGDRGTFVRQLGKRPTAAPALAFGDQGRTLAAGWVQSEHCQEGKRGGRTSPCQAVAVIELRKNGRLYRQFGDEGVTTTPQLNGP
jgi:uncharacterized delta-60 repeat protein